ncbi:IS30 family transposase, partial [Candidatus Omnitrophota bacterium]
MRRFVLSHLAKNWSPEQIAKRLRILYPDDMEMRISHKTIYSYIYVLPRGRLKRKVISCLRRAHKYRRKINKHRKKPGSIQDYL